MSSKKFKSQASSSRAASGALGGGAFGGFSLANANQDTVSSSLSYISEPPDLSHISHAQAVVAFKNLLKKDSTTKARALEDLQGIVSSPEVQNGHIEDSLLEAWIKIYPRTSIDASRRVRQLSHTLQGHIVSTAGKRIARYIGGAIGAWLAGLYDNDKLVMRAAQKSMVRAFPTEEKRAGIWKAYQTAILEFVVDAILQQTSLTLSDERTVAPDDAEGKHARVVATAMQEFGRLLAKSSPKNLDKDSDSIRRLLESRTLWKHSYNTDPFVRRSLYDLLQTCLSIEVDFIDWKAISTCLLSKSLAKSQRGSASAFSDLLLNITKQRPEIWTVDYSAKAPVVKQLLQYIKTGSEGGSSVYWSNLHQLLKLLPLGVLRAQIQEDGATTKLASSVMKAFHEGVKNREEPRQNTKAAWSSYIETGVWISRQIPDTEAFLEFLQTHLFPILEQFILANSEEASWTIDDPQALRICVQCFVSLSEITGSEPIRNLWTKLSTSLADSIKVSAPEQSQAYKKSQDTICSRANRLFALEAEILSETSNTEKLSFVSSVFEDTTISLMELSLQVLQDRNGKPYGAAAVLDEAFSKVPQFSVKFHALDSFIKNVLPALVLSPSGDRLVSILFACRGRDSFEASFSKSTDILYNAALKSIPTPPLRKFLSCINVNDMESDGKLKSLIMEETNRALQGTRQTWLDIAAVLNNQALENAHHDQIFEHIIENLSEDRPVLEALQGLLIIAKECTKAVQTFVESANGAKLISRLLYLAESHSDEVALHAESLHDQMKTIVTGYSSSKPTLQIIQESFVGVGEESISVESLVTIARESLLKTSTDDNPQLLPSLFPTHEQWEASLSPFLDYTPKQSCAIMNPLGGAVYLLGQGQSAPEHATLPRDQSQLTLAFRITYYVTKVLTANNIKSMPSPVREDIFLYFPLAIQLIDDELSVEGSTGILYLDNPETRNGTVELVSEARHLMKDWIQASGIAATQPGSDKEVDFVNLWANDFTKLEGNGPRTYRMAEAFARIITERVALGAISSAEDSLRSAMQMSGPSNPFALVATVAAYKDSLVEAPTAIKLCNQLVADLTGLNEKSQAEGLLKLVTLNVLVQGEGNIAKNIPTQRLVFFVKHLIEYLESENFGSDLTAEVLKMLTSMLPLIKEIYGSHWSDVFDIIKSLWEREDAFDDFLPVLHSSLRLFACLRKIAISDSNDDLEDSWAEAQKSHAEGLIQLLTQLDPSLHPSQPWNITADLLARQIPAVTVNHIKDVGDMFSSLSIQSRGMQRATYGVLHRVIPQLQEEVSFDVALSGAAVSLPDELLSLLLEAPTMDTLRNRSLNDDTWIGIRCYLLSWMTIFDHFSHSSIPVRERYSANIKENNCLDPLLNFTFDFLEQAQGKLVDASKFDIRSPELDVAESPKKETQWLLIHLYYQCLRHLPSQTKAWWLDSKKRVKGPVEAWTQKYISPLVIEDSLKDVSEWYSIQDWSGEDQPLQVKVSKKAAEITGSIEIDEESPPTAISIALPPTYPLQPALVTGRTRVAVDEKKWKGWLLAIQGVILFSGNLVDGLRAFRKNVQGALKGQGECPICCSVISANMQTANKKCATCKNTFHSDCLFRWFKSSNSSSCPLCRNSFLYS